MIYLLLQLLSCVSSFNIDTQSAYILKNTDSLFGYSVALHKATSANFLMIGAPSAQTEQEGVMKGGAVYKCELDTFIGDPTDVKSCEEQLSLLDDTGNVYRDRNGGISTEESNRYNILTENKTGQWLGVSVVSSDDFLVGCAHRYESRYLKLDLYDDPPRQIVGKCVATNGDFDEIDWMEYSPCIDRDSGYDNYGYCQFGTSAAINGPDLVVGAPGRSQGVGGAFHYTMEEPLVDLTAEMLPIARDKDADVFDKYMGYSSTICDLNADYIQDFIFGGPRGNTYKGEVYIYNMNDDDKLEKIEGLDATLEGSQMGGYYGHSLACTDFDNDGYADLVVGAPWYTSYADGDYPADTGRVYIYPGSWNYLPDPFEPIVIDGHQANAAFGFSLATAGDINGDGFNDLFIGAPYYNDGEGVIYLYLGSESVVLKTPSQTITPSNLNILDNIRGFGWAMSAGKDMDGNGYPDVLVGAHKSNHAVFLRTMKIVDVQPLLSFSSEEINPDEGVVDRPDGKGMAPGITLQVCFKYTGEAITSDSMVKLNYEVTLDVTKPFSRLHFNYTNPTRTLISEQTMDLKDLSIVCTSKHSIFYQEKNLDVRPIQVEIKADLAHAATFNMRAVLNQQLIQSSTKTLIISSKCPKDTGKCLVDMGVGIAPVLYDQSELYDSVVLGYVPKVTLPVTVTNKGPHHSYGTALNVTLPPYMAYKQIKQIPGYPLQIGRCDLMQGIGGVQHLLCKMPDPMLPDSKEVFGLEFKLVNMSEPVDIVVRAQVIVKEPSYEQKVRDNSITYTISVQQLAELSIRGGSSQRRLPYNNQFGVGNAIIGAVGPDVRHDYEVVMDENALNNKVSNITVDIWWPHKFSNGAWLLPLINVIVPDRLNDTVYCDWQKLEYVMSEVKEKTAWTSGEVVPAQSCADRDPERCLKLTCNIDSIQRGAAHLNGFKISLISKVHESSLYGLSTINITSFAEIVSVHTALVLPRLTEATATTELYPSISRSRNYLWIIILGILAGLFLLFLIVLILWKCNFFKRKQPPSMKAEFVTG